MMKNKRYKKRWRFLLLKILWTLSGGAQSVFSKTREIKKDEDRNGVFEQRVVYQGDRLARLDVDEDQDGRIELRQFYQAGLLSKVERDTDGDGLMDCSDIFEKEKRIRQERLGPDGNVAALTRFDGDGHPLATDRDTTGNGQFDTFLIYRDGQLAHVKKDTTASGRINVWTDYFGNIPACERRDMDEDGTIERKVSFNTKGEPEKVEQDGNADGRFDSTTWYSRSLPVKKESDLNYDGKMDRFFEMDA